MRLHRKGPTDVFTAPSSLQRLKGFKWRKKEIHVFWDLCLQGGEWFKESYGKQKSNTNPLSFLVSVVRVEGSTGSRSTYLGEAGNEAESSRLHLCIPGREPGHSHRRVKVVTNRSTALSWKELVLFCRNLDCSCYGNRRRRMQKATLFFSSVLSYLLCHEEQVRLFRPEVGGLFL